MASITSTPLPRRKKQAVYGKSTRKAYSPANAGFFEDDDNTPVLPERGSRKPPAPTNARAIKAASPPSVQRLTSPAKKSGALTRPKHSPPRTKDPFDVPSDDDGNTEVFSHAPLPPRQRFKSRLIDEPKEEGGQLAPWEQKTAKKNAPQGSLVAANLSRKKTAENAVQEEQGGPQRRGKAGKPTIREMPSQEKPNEEEEMAMTAKERLAARRRHVQKNEAPGMSEQGGSAKGLPKRSSVKVDAHETPQNKRRRVTPQPESPRGATVNADLKQSQSPLIGGEPSVDNGDIFDIPSENEVPKPTTLPTKKAMKIRQRPQRPGTLRQITPQKGLSAPYRLQGMLPKEDDTVSDVADVISPQNASGTTSTPNEEVLDTFPPEAVGSSSSHAASPISLTPKQTQLWADFFEPSDAPNTIMKKLSIAEDKAKPTPTRAVPAQLQRSSSDVPIKRTRIVDRLKASVANSSDEDSSESEGEFMDVDKIQPSAPEVKLDEHSATRDPGSERHSQATNSQDSQPKTMASSSLITYAKQRSHLADDNLESALMLDIPMDLPERPSATARRIGRPAPTSQSNSFDIEDEEQTGSGLRTIHELRAGGRNTRMMGDIEDLLADIADHKPSAKSRRRGALIELSTKMLDKSFAEQVINHGFEGSLLAECKVPTDAPTSFLIAAIVLLLLHSEPPNHALVRMGQILPDISKLLEEPSDIGKVVKERRSNISKAAQGDIVTFAEKIEALGSLWNQSKPPIVSSRIVALKVLDCTVGKLRKLGNTSTLVSSESLALLVPKAGFTGLDHDPCTAFEANMVISILEALKTLSDASDWPGNCIKSVASLPAVFAKSWQAPRHTKWLAYRLCANITNDTSIEHSAFVEHDAVRHLMEEVVLGFKTLHDTSPPSSSSETETSALNLDLLVLAIGTLINLTEHSAQAQRQAIEPQSLPAFKSIIQTFHEGQERALQAESVEESAANVAYGYLAIMLANVCQDGEARAVVRGALPGQKMDVLVDAVEEFVRHHQKVDVLESSAEAGKEAGNAWSSFTERLLGVLVKLREVEG